MTQATKTLSIIFAVSLLLVGLRIAFKGAPTSEALSGTVIQFDKAKVNRIEVKQPNEDKLVLQKNLSGWTVQFDGSNQTYPASSEIVETALTQLEQLKPKAILSRNESEFSRYQVDTTGTEVRLFDGTKVLSGVVVGRFQFVSQQEFNTFVRSTEKNDVVSVNGFLASYFNKKLDDWRNKQVWSLDKKAFMQIDFAFPGDSSFTMRKVAENTWVSGLDTLSQSKIDDTVSEFASLHASNFINDKSPETFGTSSYRFTVHLDNGQKQELQLIPKEENEFEAKATGFDYIFTLNKSSLENTLLRSKKYFIK